MALVFMGISLQEIGPEEQALLAFKKAIQLNATNILAYNGLANYYEKKNTPASKQELFKLYLTLLQLERYIYYFNAFFGVKYDFSH